MDSAADKLTSLAADKSERSGLSAKSSSILSTDYEVHTFCPTHPFVCTGLPNSMFFTRLCRTHVCKPLNYLFSATNGIAHLLASDFLFKD